MAKNPTRARYFSSGGTNSRQYSLNRDCNNITVIRTDTASRIEKEFKTAAEARRAMNNPATICTH